MFVYFYEINMIMIYERNTVFSNNLHKIKGSIRAHVLVQFDQNWIYKIRALQWHSNRVPESRVGASLEALCCVLEQATLSSV